MRFLARAMRPLLTLCIASIALETLAGPSAPVGLLVNGVSSPLAIDRGATRFTWRSVDTSRGEAQAAYQILVASSAERLAAGKADWWDSGKVDSDKSASVEYAGKPLPAYPTEADLSESTFPLSHQSAFPATRRSALEATRI